jgi:hypothetical protein
VTGTRSLAPTVSPAPVTAQVMNTSVFTEKRLCTGRQAGGVTWSVHVAPPSVDVLTVPSIRIA